MTRPGRQAGSEREGPKERSLGPLFIILLRGITALPSTTIPKHTQNRKQKEVANWTPG